MLHAKNLPNRFWAECIWTMAHIINILPQAKLGFISPFEKLWGFKPILVTSESLDVFAQYLCQLIYVASSIKRRIDVSLWDTKTKRKGGDVVILLVVGAIFQEMWCLMNHLGGLHRKRNY